MAIANMIATSKIMNINKITIQLSENLYYNNYKIYFKQLSNLIGGKLWIKIRVTEDNGHLI